MRRLVRHPAVWFSAWLCWFGLLWFLSSLEGSNAPLPFPQFDKLEHFCYFLAGGFLWAGLLSRLRPEPPAWRRIFWLVLLTLALAGLIDEWHQCYTPGRSGGDPWDWLADVLGGGAGALILKAVHRRIR